ncbi:hypothetical protein [Aestuariibius sp. HNIBRBA575]|uniref:hypothetical protein n=1 Tax=Aestuariibius sp. HNIBRBA575 TaxID=3233343 RepID=UPI0034A1F176
MDLQLKLTQFEMVQRVCVVLRGCETFEHWQNVATKLPEQTKADWGRTSPYYVMRGSIYFSLISLRSLDDFLSNRRPNSDDLIAKDLAIDVGKVLSGADRLLSTSERRKINKGMAHLTKNVIIRDDELGAALEILSKSKPTRLRLSNELGE